MDPRLAGVIATTFAVEPSAVSAETSPRTLATWDSLGHLNLVAALEAAFGVSFTMEETMSMEDAGAIARILASKTA